MAMKTLNASAFRKQCLALLDRLPAEGLAITTSWEAYRVNLPPARQRGDMLSSGAKWDAES
jgi:hypothetical protein